MKERSCSGVPVYVVTLGGTGTVNKLGLLIMYVIGWYLSMYVCMYVQLCNVAGMVS